jgi:hypothetical protein
MLRNLGLLVAASVSLLGIFNIDVEAATWESSKAKAHRLHSRAAPVRKSQRGFNATGDDCDYRFQNNDTTRKYQVQPFQPVISITD